MFKQIKNLTGREIFVGEEKFPSDGNIKLSQSIQKISEFNGIDIIESKFGEAMLPEPEAGVGLIVSHVVCQKFPDRTDLLIVGGKQKNEQGQIIGAQHLIINPSLNAGLSTDG